MKNIDKQLAYVWELAILSQKLGVSAIYHSKANDYPYWAEQVHLLNHQLDTTLKRALWKYCQRKIGTTNPHVVSAILGATDDIIRIVDFRAYCNRERTALRAELKYECAEHDALMNSWGLKFDRSGSVLSKADLAFAKYRHSAGIVINGYQHFSAQSYRQLEDDYYHQYYDDLTAKTDSVADSWTLCSAMKLRSEVIPKEYLGYVQVEDALHQLENSIQDMQSMHQEYDATIIDIGSKFSKIFQYA